jgi:hypothetical protein
MSFHGHVRGTVLLQNRFVKSDASGRPSFAEKWIVTPDTHGMGRSIAIDPSARDRVSQKKSNTPSGPMRAPRTVTSTFPRKPEPVTWKTVLPPAPVVPTAI